MRIYKQLFWILCFSFLGEAISILFHLSIPGSVIGMLLLFAALHLKWLKMEQIELVGNFLKDNLAILFVPLGVGVMTYFNVIRNSWWIFLIIMILSTVFTLGFVGWTVQILKRGSEQRSVKADDDAAKKEYDYDDS